MVLYSFWMESILFTTVFIFGLFLSSTTWKQLHTLTQIRICNTTLLYTFKHGNQNYFQTRTFAISFLYGKCSSLKFRCAIWPTVSKADGTTIPSGSNTSKVCSNHIRPTIYVILTLWNWINKINGNTNTCTQVSWPHT